MKIVYKIKNTLVKLRRFAKTKEIVYWYTGIYGHIKQIRFAKEGVSNIFFYIIIINWYL